MLLQFWGAGAGQALDFGSSGVLRWPSCSGFLPSLGTANQRRDFDSPPGLRPLCLPWHKGSEIGRERPASLIDPEPPPTNDRFREDKLNRFQLRIVPNVYLIWR